jgi:hypothetical protein
MDRPRDCYQELAFAYRADQVLKDRELVGIISNCAMNQFCHGMISHCSIDTEFSGPGTDVVVL